MVEGQGRMKIPKKKSHLGKEGCLTPPMAVKYAKECVLQVLLVSGLLVGHPKLIFHVLPTPLVLITRHPKVQPDAGRHSTVKHKILLDLDLAFDSTSSHV